MPGGRPKEYDRLDVAKKMLEWAKDPESMNMNGFSVHVMIPATTILRWKDEDPQFREAYELTRQILGNRREKALSKGELHVKAYDLNAKVYDPYLKEEWREERRFESDLKSKENEKVGAEFFEKADLFLNQIDRLQQARDKAD